MKHGWMALVGLCLGSTAAATVGCDGESKLTVVTEEGATAPHVNLPTVPTLPPPPPVNHTDGSFTVYGVRHQATRDPNLWSKQQRVHGFIVSVYTARNPRGLPCTEADRCVEERPHVYISDNRAERDPAKMMMVTGYATFQHEVEAARTAARSGRPPTATQLAQIAAGLVKPVPTDFDEGAEVVVTGNLTRRAANGQADSNGLLEYTSHTTTAPAPPPANAPRR
jgi:hypothetical protein